MYSHLPSWRSHPTDEFQYRQARLPFLIVGLSSFMALNSQSGILRLDPAAAVPSFLEGWPPFLPLPLPLPLAFRSFLSLLISSSFDWACRARLAASFSRLIADLVFSGVSTSCDPR